VNLLVVHDCFFPISSLLLLWTPPDRVLQFLMNTSFQVSFFLFAVLLTFSGWLPQFTFSARGTLFLSFGQSAAFRPVFFLFISSSAKWNFLLPLEAVPFPIAHIKRPRAKRPSTLLSQGSFFSACEMLPLLLHARTIKISQFDLSREQDFVSAAFLKVSLKDFITCSKNPSFSSSLSFPPPVCLYPFVLSCPSPLLLTTRKLICVV